MHSLPNSGLEGAQVAARAAYDGQLLAGGQSSSESERSAVHVIRKLLSTSDIAMCHAAGAASVADQVVWPRRRMGKNDTAHDVSYTDAHVALFLHCDRYLLKSWPALYEILVGGMQSQSGACAVVGPPLNVRCIELHTYDVGGGLFDPGHRDCGSALTMSVLLSTPKDCDGGSFVTWCEGQPVVHELECGDAVLFRSEKCHNISRVTRGTRHSLVVELWEAATNVMNRYG